MSDTPKFTYTFWSSQTLSQAELSVLRQSTKLSIARMPGNADSEGNSYLAVTDSIMSRGDLNICNEKIDSLYLHSAGLFNATWTPMKGPTI